MDNLTFSKIKEALDKYNNIGIATPVDPTVDEMGAALSLYLSFKDLGKTLSIATPNQPLVEVSSLVGIDDVKTTLGSESGDMIMYLPYKEGEIEKVSSVIEGNFLKLIVKSGVAGLGFSEKEIQFSRSTNAPELLFVIGAARVSDLGKLFDPTALKDTVVVNIDNKPDNQGYGDIIMVSARLSSISEAVANLILSLGFKIDLDISQNLMLGIATATNNFLDPKTSSLAFEMAGVLMRQGALRPTTQTQVQTQTQFDSQVQQPQQRSQNILDREDRPEIKDIISELAKQRFDSPIAPSEPEQVSQPVQPQPQANQDQSLQNPPEDWLEPKIYKGSTNF